MTELEFLNIVKKYDFNCDCFFEKYKETIPDFCNHKCPFADPCGNGAAWHPDIHRKFLKKHYNIV